jgi:hypothetical protein
MPAQFKNDAVLRLVVLLLREAHFRNIGADRSAGFTQLILVPRLAGIAGGIIILSIVRRCQDQHAIAVDVHVGRGRPATGKTQSSATMTLLAPQTQPQANVGAGNAPSDTPTVAQTTVSPSMKSLGFDLAIRESVQEPESVEEEEPEVEHSVGW